MNLILQHGRPENMADRLEKEQKVYKLLDQLHIEYDRIDHEPAMHMDVCEEIDKTLGAMICKNLFLCNRPHRLAAHVYPLELRITWRNSLM